KRYQPERHAVKPGTTWKNLSSTNSQSTVQRVVLLSSDSGTVSDRKSEGSGRRTYSQRKERFSATIRPFWINRQRQALTRPSSGESSPIALNAVLGVPRTFLYVISCAWTCSCNFSWRYSKRTVTSEGRLTRQKKSK